MDCLPENLRGRRYYRPTGRGEEARTGAVLEEARAIREAKKAEETR